MKAISSNSNTTLVKVKYPSSRDERRPKFNSNTTLVKVKSNNPFYSTICYIYSNTTLVKVKLAVMGK